MNTPVSLKLKQLLLDKNIDMPVKVTIAEVVMWLYDKHEIWIWVEGNYGENQKFFPRLSKGVVMGMFDSPTEAYEAAIKYSLENLI